MSNTKNMFLFIFPRERVERSAASWCGEPWPEREAAGACFPYLTCSHTAADVEPGPTNAPTHKPDLHTRPDKLCLPDSLAEMPSPIPHGFSSSRSAAFPAQDLYGQTKSVKLHFQA